MSTLFISVDVETSGPSPVISDLLTLGAVCVLDSGTVLEGERLYLRLDYGRPIRWERHCFAWWEEQEAEVRRLAYGERRADDGMRCSPYNAAVILDAWVSSGLERWGCTDAAFVAHPAGFDWQFVNALCWEQLGRNPFGYRSLCLRSMGFGLSAEDWGRDRTDDTDLYVKPTMPHHALSDAVAQAHQLGRMLKLRGRR